MNRTLAFTSAVVAVLALAAAPAAAQGRRDNGRQRNDGRADASQPAPRQDGARQAERRQAPRQVGPRADGSQSRASEAPRAVPRGDRRSYQSPSPRPDGRNYGSPRPDYSRPSYSRPSYSRPSYSRRYVRPYNFRPYRPRYFSRPYYSFRPRLNIGFGLWLGDPVPYPYAYLGDYRPRVYGYYGGGSYNVSPGVPLHGGVSFDIQPSDADLFIDGEYVGPVGTFTPYGEPLTLTPGRHEIAVQREGFRPMEWEVAIQPGQVIPYRGEMDRY